LDKEYPNSFHGQKENSKLKIKKKQKTNKQTKQGKRRRRDDKIGIKQASKQLPWTREKPKKIKTPNKQTE
jgi:hypothetical protein